MADRDGPEGRDKPQADIVMRGGVASGVVYPGLVVELARHYRFRTIGGASAGAIAAGVVAAAQYGVLNGQSQAFSQTIAPIPDWLAERAGGRTRLHRLFSASRGLEPLERLRDRILQAGIGPGLLHAEIAALFDDWRTLLALPLPLILALLLAMAMRESLAVGGPGGFLVAVALLAFAALAMLGTILVLLWRHVRRNLFPPGILDRLRAAGFGICGGSEPGRWRDWDPRQAGPPADHLADWLHGRIQKAAGLPPDAPLTMGHLWAGSSTVGGVTAWDWPREIDLVLTTTNLSHQVPHRFPFLEKPGMWLYFVEEELEQVLPRPVVAAMIAATKATRAEHEGSGNPERQAIASLLEISRNGRTYWRLPRPEQLPVLLGVRMSLSFPVLLAAVRLWAWDRSDGADTSAQPGGSVQLRPCWFLDGGITSNFPVTMFDSLLPSRPTFCINLADLPPGGDATSRIEIDVGDPRRIAPEWRIDLDSGGLGRFAGAIVDTARNGHENDLMTMPTCRNRIVTIRLDPEREGGLNLDMAPETIRAMARYGEEAARALLDAYPAHATGPDSNWARHRQLRLRKSLAALESLLVGFDAGWRAPSAGAPSWRFALARLADETIDRPGRRHVARRLFDRWTGLAGLVAAATRRPETSFFDGVRNPDDPTSLNRRGQAPRPRMGLRLTPTGSQDPLLG